MGKLIVGLFTVGLVIFLAMLFLGTATMRFDLITVRPAFWLFAAGIVFVIGGGWLVSADVPVGGLFATLGAVLLVIGGYKAIWPKTSTATNNAQEFADVRAAIAINKLISPQRIRCDRTSQTEYRDQVTGISKVYYIVNPETHRIECADWKGYTINGQEYKEVTDEVIGLIVQQNPPPSPPPPPTTEPARVTATIAPTPLPDLTEGMISEVKPDSGWSPIQQDPK